MYMIYDDYSYHLYLIIWYSWYSWHFSGRSPATSALGVRSGLKRSRWVLRATVAPKLSAVEWYLGSWQGKA